MVWLIVLLRGRGCTRRAGDAARRAGRGSCAVGNAEGSGGRGFCTAGGESCAAEGTTARRTGLRRGGRGAAALPLLRGRGGGGCCERGGLLRGLRYCARMRRGGRSFCAAHRGLDDTTRLLDIDALV